jgi:hypothetical protein
MTILTNIKINQSDGERLASIFDRRRRFKAGRQAVIIIIIIIIIHLAIISHLSIAPVVIRPSIHPSILPLFGAFQSSTLCLGTS